jgi:hypothetical protein
MSESLESTVGVPLDQVRARWALLHVCYRVEFRCLAVGARLRRGKSCAFAGMTSNQVLRARLPRHNRRSLQGRNANGNKHANQRQQQAEDEIPKSCSAL